MIATCPNCETRFEIPDDKYRPGRKARCSNCGFVFPLPERDEAGISRVGDGQDAVPPPLPGALSEAARGVEDDIDAALAEAGAPSPDAAFPDGGSRSAAVVSGGALPGDSGFPDGVVVPEAEVVEIPPPPASYDDVVSPIGEPPARKRSKKKIFLILGIVFALALLSYGGIMVYSAFFAPVRSADPVRATDGGVVSSLGGRTGGADAAKEAERQAAVSRLALENVRQQTVPDNEQTGPMVVIEGAVVNNFDTPKDLILLEVTLYDSKGNALVMREQYCGITLSLLQLRTLSKAALESALGNQVDILTNNADIPPGGRVPFTTVFFDLPNTAYEFEVKIVDVQDPSEKK